MTKEEKLDKIKKIITKLIDSNNIIEGKYEMPYSNSNDDLADWKVTLNVNRVSLWETENYDRCKYSGSIYLKVDVMIRFEGDWEKMQIWDLPSWVKDDIEDNVLDNIENFLPVVCIDITFE
jgi:hypothetical protein